MKQVFTIFKKEFKDYFVSPIAYIVISIFLVATGWFFFSTFFLSSQANLRGFFALLPIIFTFLIPAISMRLFSEEINIGSYEMLVTMPVTFNEIILGKFLAALAMVAAMLLPTITYPISISFMGQLDWGPVIGGYLGAMLLGGAYCGIGLFASALTRNQIIAFILGWTTCFVLWLIDKMLILIPQKFVSVIGYFGADYHFKTIAKGVIDSRNLLYFISVIFISLYCVCLTMQEKE